MLNIVCICGSPSEQSRSKVMIDYLQWHLEKFHYTCEEIQIKDLPMEVLMRGKYNHPAIKQITDQINQADGIVLCCPVYKGAYPGVLKAFLDILPQHIFQEKIVYPLMVGGTKAHLLALEFSLKPLLHHLKGECLSGVFVLDTELKRAGNPSSAIVNPALEARIQQQLTEFIKKTNYNKEVFMYE